MAVEGGKKIVYIVILLVLILGAAFVIMKTSGRGGSKPPDHLMAQPVEKIDSESLEIITKSRGEWEDLGHEEGKYRNPDSKKYTMVPAITCDSCRKRVPDVVKPTIPRNPTPDQERAHRNASIERMRNHKCASCDESPYPEGTFEGESRARVEDGAGMVEDRKNR